MTYRCLCTALALSAFALATPRADAQPAGEAPDLLFQGFHWNAHPGDLASPFFGVWWDSLATVAPDLRSLGVQTVWIPSPAKGAGGRNSMGYDLYDYYDVGTRYQKGGTRTRFGKKSQFDAMMAAFQANGLRTMADVVLNHRDGGDTQAEVACVPGGGAPFLKYNTFTPSSGRLPGVPEHFHANPTHCDYGAPYHDEPFGQDICYFDGLDQTLDAAAPNAGWYHGTHSLGAMGDSLVAWGRWLVDDLGVDEVRVDAVKHIEPGFLAPWLTELAAGDQPFAVGEYFGGTGEIRAYHDAVEGFNPSGGRPAGLAMFDFGLRFALKGMADSGGFYDMRELGSAGLLATGLDPFSVVTFVDNHDFDRIGWQGADCSDPDAVPYGNACLKLGVDSGHDPIVSRKHLAYAYTLAAEGRPTVWWKDVFWFGLGQEIGWLASLRRLTAQGPSAPMAALNPNGEAAQQDLFVLRRDGTGSPRYGALVAINDNGVQTHGAWVDSPHADYELRDYSDRFLFQTTRAYADGRAYVQAAPGDYAWYAPTGLYPRPVDEPASSFTLGAEPGGQLHHVVLRAADARRFRIDGAPIEVGDEIAVLGPDGEAAAGLGRVGQRLRWDGEHDMLLEVLGNADGTTAGGRLGQGDPLRIAVRDASTGAVAVAYTPLWTATDTTLPVSPLRASSRGGAVDATTTDSDGTYAAGAVSVVDRFFARTDAGTLALDLVDDPRPVEVAPEGETLSFRLAIRHVEGETRQAKVWAELVGEDGSRRRYELVRLARTFEPGQERRLRVTQRVPAHLPAGRYTYTLMAGLSATEVVAAFTIPLTKATSAAPDPDWPTRLDGHQASAELDAPETSALAEPSLDVASGAAPNPFTDRTTVRLVPAADGPARAELVDALGRRVAVLFDGEVREGVPLALQVDGRGLPSGLYLVRFADSATQQAVRLVRR